MNYFTVVVHKFVDCITGKVLGKVCRRNYTYLLNRGWIFKL